MKNTRANLKSGFSCQYDSILELVKTTPPTPIAPGWESRLIESWAEDYAPNDGEDADDLPNPSGYEQSLRGYTNWLRDSSWDLWSASFAISTILFDNDDGDEIETTARVIATCIAHGASLADFADFDT